GLLLVVGAVGSLAAALALPRFNGGSPRPRLTTYALFVSAATMAVIAGLTTLAAALGVWLVWQTAVELAILNGITYRQRVVPDELLGRVNVIARMVSWGGQPFGAAIGGAIATVADVRVALLIMVAPAFIAAVATAKPLHDA